MSELPYDIHTYNLNISQAATLDIDLDAYPDILEYNPNTHPRKAKAYPYGKIKDQKTFILKFLWIHGIGRYDITNTRFINSKEHVEVTCHFTNKHDSPHTFKTSPNTIISKNSGCSKCSGKYSWTTSEWIEEATKRWDGEYNYECVEYKGAFDRIYVTHNKCGHRFLVTPDNHMRGRGCPKCKKARPRKFNSTEEYLEEFFKAQGYGKFDVSEVVVKNQATPIRLRCIEHDRWFEAYPYAMLNKTSNWCPMCGSTKKTPEIWREAGDALYGEGYYDYSLLEDNPIGRQKIRCVKHNNIFEKTYTEHIRQKTGCRECYLETSKMSQEEFIRKCEEVHEEKNYDLSLIDYQGWDSKIKVVCPIHGLFERRAQEFGAGRGCPDCSKIGFYNGDVLSEDRYGMNGNFYVCKVTHKETGESCIKVGISIQPEKRYSGSEYKHLDISYIKIYPMSVYDSYNIERMVLKEMKHKKYIPSFDFVGKTECFEIDAFDDIELDSMIEETIENRRNFIINRGY